MDFASATTTTVVSAGEVIMAALLRLPVHSFSDLTRSLADNLDLHRRRLTFLLLSPLHFALTLSHLRSLSLHEKTLLLARLLLSSLHLLLPTAASPHPHRLSLRDLDAALLLVAMCDSHDPSAPIDSWRATVSRHVLHQALSPSGLGDGPWPVLCHHVDAAAKCRRLMETMAGGGKERSEVAASVASVVALPWVDHGGASGECVVCREEMGEAGGRMVCELPCSHRLHWGCALGWLRRRHTCPCCRHELPTENVACEMGRMWRAAVRSGSDHKQRPL
ncbi:E3 ubiquitin-protein ligase SGR9, amyloplastic-like [Zingiber officinale]|uniref:RING-type domain-containing protein n=1 Tax=Zingiber officinale TaxID=94328 RepID=A0A8J5C8L5_ZINOF|nr:E3 ubiquitin-protein ligase SGR9, amyloplastic-like [Zingiber officinale]KAG6470604.1 hypothetical protein ZIOFF_071678 [Zingiber officinale]